MMNHHLILQFQTKWKNSLEVNAHIRCPFLFYLCVCLYIYIERESLGTLYVCIYMCGIVHYLWDVVMINLTRRHQGHDHVIRRVLHSHPKVAPLTWSTGISVRAYVLEVGVTKTMAYLKTL